MNFLKRPIYLSLLVFSIGMLLFYVQIYMKEPTIEAESAVLIDMKSGEVVYKKNENMPLAPASMSKLMTEYIVLEKIEQGMLDWEDYVTVSEHAANSEGVKIDVKAGDRLTVEELVHAMVISSANNAAIALAEHIAGSENEFTRLMNEEAERLQLSQHTRFVNATGLENERGEESKMTALDVAKLAKYLLNNYPAVVNITKLTSYELKSHHGTLTTTNKMLYPANRKLYFEGVDGLKTGFTDEAGYCFAGTAMQGDKRMISVVMGTSDGDKRFRESKKLFSYGFHKFYIPFL
ncbi:D-alanyl-D-alanine carboxypeptidase family protein [Bacillus manliponensis]|uniref:D-alanyl-D-alanine carboxypeptidase family protein n=1 Tax=Bacillus manliponensis TaxID=574376 RepID=UPI0035191A97